MSERGALLCPRRLRGVELAVALFDAAGPLVRDDLFTVWCSWCEEQKRHPGAKQSFGRDLRTALPWLKTSQPRIPEGKRQRFYEGLRIKPGSIGISLDGVDLN